MLLYFLPLVCLLCAGATAENTPDFGWDDITPLDEYVHREDGVFDWEILDAYTYNDTVTTYIVNVTSHVWTSDEFVDRWLWWHLMCIAIPEDLDMEHLDSAFMAIYGSDNPEDGSYPQADDIEPIAIAIVAQRVHVVSGLLMNNPNQPCYFQNDPDYKRRREDSIIAWTWRSGEMMNASDPDVIMRLPMTKGAKRGLDAIHEVAKELVPESDIDRFYVMGASKRGWTAWSLAATDQRVVAVAPLVFDLLKIHDNVMSHYQAMDGGYSFALGPYYAENLTQDLLNPMQEFLWDVEDMYRYRSRLTLPKFLLIGSQDEFFHFQDTHNWWQGFTDPKHLFLCANGDHILITCWLQVAENIVSFFLSVMRGIELPDIDWTLHETEGGDSGHIIMHTKPAPLEADGIGIDVKCRNTFPEFRVRGWRAPTANQEKGHNRRDWRLFMADQEPGGVTWRCANETVTLDDFEEDEDGNVESATFRYDTDAEEDEWTGFFMEAEYEGQDGLRMFFTTEGNIIPDTYPAEPCTSPEECYGTLI